VSISSYDLGLQGGKKSFADAVKRAQWSKNADSLTIMRGLLTLESKGISNMWKYLLKNVCLVYFSGELFSESKLFFLIKWIEGWNFPKVSCVSLISTGCLLYELKPTTRFFSPQKYRLKNTKKCFLLLDRKMCHSVWLNLILVFSSCRLMFSIVYFQE